MKIAIPREEWPQVGDVWRMRRNNRTAIKTIDKIYLNRQYLSADENGRVRGARWCVRWQRLPKGRYTGCTLRFLMRRGTRVETEAQVKARREAHLRKLGLL